MVLFFRVFFWCAAVRNFQVLSCESDEHRNRLVSCCGNQWRKQHLRNKQRALWPRLAIGYKYPPQPPKPPQQQQHRFVEFGGMLQSAWVPVISAHLASLIHLAGTRLATLKFTSIACHMGEVRDKNGWKPLPPPMSVYHFMAKAFNLTTKTIKTLHFRQLWLEHHLKCVMLRAGKSLTRIHLSWIATTRAKNSITVV